MYNEAQLMYDNEICRYVVGNRSGHLHYGEDGSLTVFLQHKNPGGGKESNWLPTNNGLFTVIMGLSFLENTGHQPPAIFKFH